MNEERLITEPVAELVRPPPFRPVRFSEWHEAAPAAPQLALRLKRVAWVRAGTAAGIGLLWLLLILVNIASGFRYLSLCAGLLVYTSWWWIRAKHARVAGDVADLMEFPPVIPQFPVEVQLVRDGAQYGNDAGVISFSEASLHFQGRRTCFDIARSAVNVTELPPQAGRRWVCIRLTWQADGHNGTVVIDPVDRLAGRAEPYRARFYAEFNRWKGVRSDPGALSVFPPLLPTQRTLAEAGRTAVLYAAVLVAAVLTYAVAWPCWNRLHEIDRITAGAISAGLLLMVVVSLVQAARRLRKLRAMSCAREMGSE